MNRNLKKSTRRRYFVLYVFAAVFFVMIFTRLFSLQLKSGKQYRSVSDARLSLSVPVIAPRGEITDRYGRPFVTNRTGYFVVLEKVNETTQERHASILNVLKILTEKGSTAEYEDSLPISFDSPFRFQYPKEEKNKAEQEKKFKTENGFDENSTAADVMNALCEKYKIDDNYSNKEKRLSAGVRFGMEKNGFSVSAPYTILEDADMETVTKIKEHADLFPSVAVHERPVREYLYPQTATHILGRVGKISSTEYDQLKNSGYGRNDYIGKQGAEKAFEQYLRGTDGVSSIERKIDGESTNFIESVDPIPGNTVILTLDLDLQLAAEQTLKKTVEETKSSASSKNGGSVVAVDVNSGEILATASYPTYDITEFSEKYNEMAEDPSKPMFNRALSGLYEPGSTFKPITTIAAIDSGVLKPDEIMETKGEYKYLDRTFKCNIFRTKGITHGTINVSEAIGVSCNYFFYEVGRRTGIEKIAETAEKFGLGSLTGVELSGEEAKGKIATPENREQNGGKWYPGDVLQAAIGQSDNLFSPLALANYTATLANGGTNYKTKLLKAVKSETDETILKSAQPQINQMAGASKEALTAVKDGMLKVTEPGGTAYSVFAGLPVSVAGKTGSAQVPGGTNGLFVGYAPAENPQIAVSVVLENGDSGTKAARVAREVLESYFEKPKTDDKKPTEEKPYTLLP